ncbi:MAG TPA: sulfatase-like hydrolase/transferase [Puia sp.]|nr:sulfatase-like hydrolase/transferase [Puia sp.]
MKQKLINFPIHPFGIIIFFLSHGYSENAGLINFKSLFLFCLEAFAFTCCLLALIKWALASWSKAGLITSLVIFFFLFYGALQDFFLGSGYLVWLSRYRFLLPLGVLSIISVFFFIKRSKRDYYRLTQYLNLLLLILIVVDIGMIFFRSAQSQPELSSKKNNVISQDMPVCEDCERPDIYLLLMDEYCGTKTLKNYFNYDNGWFISFLKEKGFYVASNARSNYSSTPLSVASTFDMNYIGWMKGRKKLEIGDYSRAANTITNSATIKFLQACGYQIKNYSIFDILGQPAKLDLHVLPVKLRLITSKTLLSRMERDLLWNVTSTAARRFSWLAKKFQDQYKAGNQEILSLTHREIHPSQDQPRFIYSHFFMPHFPCVFDSLGKENLFDINASASSIDRAYLQYHVYASKIAKELILDIQAGSRNKAVIIFMSDHGYRSMQPHGGKKLSVNDNFYSIYLPSADYGRFYDSLSGVNQFRIMLNTLFKQQLPLLRDSIVVINQ